MSGSPLDDVAHCYREALPNDIKEEFRHRAQLCKEFFGAALLPVLRDFMTDQLTTDRWSVDASLKEYLGYTGAFKEDEQEVFDEHFPDIVTLRHAHSLFQYLQSLS